MKLDRSLPSPGFPFPRGGERGRLVFLAFLVLVFGAGYVWLRWQAATDHDDTLDEAAESAGAAAEQPLDIVRNPSADVDERRLSEVKDRERVDRLIREPDAYTHLVTEAHKLTPGDLEVLGLAPLDVAALREDPSAHRGRPFDARGTVETLDAVAGDKYQEFRGTLVTPAGERCAFTVLREPEVRPGDVARIQGFFFKLIDVETAPGTYAERVPLLVGKALLPSYLKFEPVTDLAGAPLEHVRDQDLQDMLDPQEDVLFHVLNYVRSMSPEQKAAAQGAEVDWAELRRRPDEFRGKLVHLLVKCPPDFQWETVLGPGGENPLDHERFWAGICGKGERLFRWVGFEPVRPEQIGEFDIVHMTGVFFKNVAWENKRGQVYSGPLIVPVRVEPFRTPETGLGTAVGWTVGVLGCVLVVLIGVSLFSDRRSTREFEKDFLARKKRRLREVLEKKGPPPAGTRAAAPRPDPAASSRTPPDQDLE